MSVRDAEPHEPPSWPPNPLLVRVIRDPLPDADELADQLRDRFTVLGFEGFEVGADAPPKAPDDLASLLPDWLGDTAESPQALAAAAREPAPAILPPTSSELIRLSRARRATLAGRSYMHEARRRRVSRRARGQVLGLTTTLALILGGASATVLAALAIQEISSKEVTPVAGGFPAVSFLGQQETFARGYPATAFLRNKSELASEPPGGFIAAAAEEIAERTDGAGGERSSTKPRSSSPPPAAPASDKPSQSSGGSAERPSKPRRNRSQPAPQRRNTTPRSAPQQRANQAPQRQAPTRSAPSTSQQAPAAKAPAPAPKPIQPAKPAPSSGDSSLGTSPSL